MLAKTMIIISKSLIILVNLARLYLSAIWPAKAEKRKNGKIKFET